MPLCRSKQETMSFVSQTFNYIKYILTFVYAFYLKDKKVKIKTLITDVHLKANLSSTFFSADEPVEHFQGAMHLNISTR